MEHKQQWGSLPNAIIPSQRIRNHVCINGSSNPKCEGQPLTHRCEGQNIWHYLDKEDGYPDTIALCADGYPNKGKFLNLILNMLSM